MRRRIVDGVYLSSVWQSPVILKLMGNGSTFLTENY